MEEYSLEKFDPSDPLRFQKTKDEFRKIKEAKLIEIATGLKSLYIINKSIDLYKDSQEIDFVSLKDKILNNFNADGEVYNIFRFIGIEDYCISQSASKSYAKEILASLLSINYKPPCDIHDIYNHLLALYSYYDNVVDIEQRPVFSEFYADLSLIKLMRASALVYSNFFHRGKRELTRIKKASQRVIAISDRKKTYIYEIYYQNPNALIKPGMKQNKVAVIIKQIYNERQRQGLIPKSKGYETPSLDSIKRYLMEDERIKKEFEKQGRFLILQT